MKFASILVSLMAVSIFAQAQTDEFQQFDMAKSTPSVDEMTLVASNTDEATAGMQTMQTPEQQAMFGKETSTWNFNLGMSEFDSSYGSLGGFKGKGLSFEVQKRFMDMFYVGAAYMNYTTEGSTSWSGEYGMSTTKSSVGVGAFSLEGHLIRLPLPGRSEFFASVTGGFLTAMSFGSEDQTFIPRAGVFYGAGIGLNISNQIGIRADVKSTADVRSYNSVSLVGYY
ncbi:MAG: hypothetical protein JSU04_07310 [Bdellovibrionales bacterium]|nr:hypothetical protein [Bdellovibrionales bacterium]